MIITLKANTLGKILFHARFIRRSYRYRGNVVRAQTQINTIIVAQILAIIKLVENLNITPVIILKK